MNLDELKTVWRVYDQKIKTSQTINDKLIESMIKERSTSRVALIKKQYQFFSIMLAAEFILIIAILTGNPFDFTYRLQFVPYIFLGSCILIALVNILKLYKQLNDNFSGNPIGVFLKIMVAGYEQNKVYEKWFGILFFSVGLIIPLSFMPHKIEKNGLSSALFETVLMMAGMLLLYFIAFRLGAFKNRNEEKFRNYLEELNELKAMSSELDSND
jgi:hypothetical protein